MAEGTEFDVSEMALATYLLARAYNKPITGLPVVVNRGFHHGRIKYNVNAGIRNPKDLEGKRVGVRSYTQTTPMWARGVLAHDYDVELDKIHWVAFEQPHVRAYHAPSNVVMAPADWDLGDMLASGEIDAAIGETPESDQIRPMFKDASRVQAEWYRKEKIYPINHMIVVKSQLAREHPELLPALYDTFKVAKQGYVDFLHGDGPFEGQDKARKQLSEIVGGDPLPYGIIANLSAFEYGARLAYEQHITPRFIRIEEMFEPEVLNFD
jgi:4,5-dihydroxyphthalate decarboxylase